jgi:adenine-specific DNA-methyltransferase
MKIQYPNKRDKRAILDSVTPAKFDVDFNLDENLLIKGENINVLKSLLETRYKNKIDLVYIDPPFATKNTFRTGKERSATISSSAKDEIAYIDDKTGDEFIEFLRERIIFLRELLSPEGSFYLHIDYKIGHYVKIMLDEIFGLKNFRNDITRIKCNPKNFKRQGYGNVKDLILFYTKSDKFIWNEPLVKREEGEISKLFSKVDKKGRRYTTNPLHAPGETKNGPTGQMWKGKYPPAGRHWRYDPKVLDELESQGLIEWSANNVPRKIIYADDYELKRMQDIWEFKDGQNPVYPTQKNLEMLELIIKTSSNKNSIVLDSFSGSGTTLVAANILERKWIGIDNSEQAIKVAKKRLDNGGLFSKFKFIEAK